MENMSAVIRREEINEAGVRGVIFWDNNEIISAHLTGKGKNLVKVLKDIIKRVENHEKEQ